MNTKNAATKNIRTKFVNRNLLRSRFRSAFAIPASADKTVFCSFNQSNVLS